MKKVFLQKEVLLVFLSVMIVWGISSCSGNESQKYYMLVGTYSSDGSKGIYVMDFDSETGEFNEISTQGDTENPSYLDIHGNYVYAVSETGGETPGSLSAYYFDKKNGKLEFLNNQATGGDAPCYVETDKTGKFVAVANYTGGSVALFRTDENGALAPDKQLIQHVGAGVNPDRQEGPHAHESVFSPDQKYLLTPDLGKDSVMIYRFDRDAAQPLDLVGGIASEPGAGPRHILFNPTFSVAYLINEMIPYLMVYTYDDGNFTKIQQLDGWPEGFGGEKDGATLKISPDGKFLYVSHRGDQNSIAIYSIDQTNGKLTLKGSQSVLGKGPRDFDIDPSGNFLVVANYATNNLVTFRIDKTTGLLSEAGNTQLPIPVCVKFTTKQ